MPKFLFVLLLSLLYTCTDNLSAQENPDLNSNSTGFTGTGYSTRNIMELSDKKSKNRIRPSAGFSAGVASIDAVVGFTFSTFAELRSGQVSLIPMITYWNADKSTNFEFGLVSQFYLTSSQISPYVDFGLGVNIYNSDSLNFTKASLIAGAGLEFKNISKSFNLNVDGKYKLIASNTGNIPCFLVTAGLSFPFH